MAIMLTTSCDQAELRKSNDIPVQVVETRSTEDCEDCPLEDCCCTVTAIPIPPSIVIPTMTLDFCGTTSPSTISICSESNLGNCNDIVNGQFEQISFDNLNRRKLFCASSGLTFGINSFPINPNVMLAITCQTGSGSPQTVYYILSGTGAKPYWQLNEACELEPCF